MRIHADSCGSGYGSWSDFKVTKIEILHEKYTNSGEKIKKHTYEDKKAFLEGRKRDLFLSASMFLGPDPLIQYGSGSSQMNADPDQAK
jgi:hypothetical protein